MSNPPKGQVTAPKPKPKPKPKPNAGKVWHEKGLFWGTISACISLILAGIGTGIGGGPVIAKWMFVLALPFGCVACCCVFELVSSKKIRTGLRILSCVLIAIGILEIAKHTIRERLALTVFEDQRFTAILRTGMMRPPDYVIISCPDNEEDTCIFAASFIPLFQRAGWKVENASLERVRLGRPDNEISIVTYGPPLVDNQNPDQGVWTQINPWAQTLNTDFQLLGITPNRLNDPALPPNKVRVYIGSIPERKRPSYFYLFPEFL